MTPAPRTDEKRRRSRTDAPRLSLVVRHRPGSDVTPAYVRRLALSLDGAPIDILIADETLRIGSTDLLAAAEMEGLPVRVFRARAAVAEAVAAARGEYVALVDADERHPPELVPELFFQAVSGDVDMVLAVRRPPAGRPSRTRRAALAMLGERVRGVTDPLTPFFIARRALVLGVVPKPGRTLLALDVLLEHSRASVVEIPIARAARPEAESKPPLRRRLEIALRVARLSREAAAARTASVKDRAVAAVNEGIRPWMLLALFAVIGVAAVLRFWALPHLHWYGQDESHASAAAYRMIHDHRPVLRGQPTSRGVYLGPGYFYLVAPFYLLFGLSPFAGAFLAAIAGVGATYLVWRIGRSVFSPGAGLAAAAIFATAPIAVYFGRFGWNPNTLPFFAGIFLFGLLKAHDNPRWLIASAFAAGLAPQLHATGLILPAALAVWVFSNRPSLTKRGWQYIFGAFALPLLPMAAGELHTRGAGVKAWLKLLIGKGASGTDTGGSLVKAFKDLFVESIGTPRFTVAVLLVVVALIGVVLWERRIWNDPRRGPAFRTVAMFEVIGALAAVAWHGQMFAYWLLPWLPGAIVLFAGGLVEFTRAAAAWVSKSKAMRVAPAIAVLVIAGFNVAAVAKPVRLADQFDSVSPAAFQNVDAAATWIAARVRGTYRLLVYTPYAWDTAHNSSGAFDYLLLRKGFRQTAGGAQLFVVAMEDVATPHVRFTRSEVLRTFDRPGGPETLLGSADFGGLTVYEFKPPKR